MIKRAIYTPLFTEQSKSVESPIFFVNPGEVVQAMGFGFSVSKTKVEETERTVPQIAYLEQVLFTEGVKESVGTQGGCSCTKLYNLSDFTTDILAYEEVKLCGCCMTLSQKTNMLLINLPGAYRFVLNDSTAIGMARIYLRTFTKDEFPWNSKFMIGE